MSREQDRSKGRTTGKFRCLYCFERLSPPRGATQYTCPSCGYSWRVWWYSPTEPRVRGPVWEEDEKLTQQKIKEQGGE
jgi:DNA-directed RNA polymerase subunit RPC12/RpoP